MAEEIKRKKLDLRELLEEIAEDEAVEPRTRKLAEDKLKLMKEVQKLDWNLTPPPR